MANEESMKNIVWSNFEEMDINTNFIKMAVFH
jgi:hypothetical protein